ncbi:hypothetical protein ACGRHY_26780 [Streptomyces sp. HK10]|uniref:hypothetical protein n=1 Tax=Streptomyces sp. HK10 TaxID=3373255 RepID=UPI00374970E8
MSERILTLPGSTDRFIVTDRPEPTLTDRYQPLPDGMNTSHVTVVRAYQIRAGDIVVASFTDGPGTRYAEHVGTAFVADPRGYTRCLDYCEECEDIAASGLTADRFVCLAPSNSSYDCVTVFRNTPVAIIPADTATRFPSLDSVPLLPDLFTLDGEHGPYEALPVSRTWGPYDAISVTRTTAEQITADLPSSRAGRHLRCRWLRKALLITSDPRLRREPGRSPGLLIRPDADGRYRIGGLWRWVEWPAEQDDDVDQS